MTKAPRSIRLFSVLLLTAAAIDLANNLWLVRNLGHLGGRNLATLIGALLPPMIALAFWFLIARWWSVIAKWVYAAFLAVSLLAIGYALATRGTAALTGPFLVALFTEALKIAAAAMLFRRDARAFFAEDVK